MDYNFYSRLLQRNYITILSSNTLEKLSLDKSLIVVNIAEEFSIFISNFIKTYKDDGFG